MSDVVNVSMTVDVSDIVNVSITIDVSDIVNVQSGRRRSHVTLRNSKSDILEQDEGQGQHGPAHERRHLIGRRIIVRRRSHTNAEDIVPVDLDCAARGYGDTVCEVGASVEEFDEFKGFHRCALGGEGAECVEGDDAQLGEVLVDGGDGDVGGGGGYDFRSRGQGVESVVGEASVEGNGAQFGGSQYGSDVVKLSIC